MRVIIMLLRRTSTTW